jgi:hypothetical protein
MKIIAALAIVRLTSASATPISEARSPFIHNIFAG